MIKLRPYQNDLYKEVVEKIDCGIKRILIQAETGWGKSILIGHIANNLKGRTLILTHRIELLVQNSEWVEGVGVLTSKVKDNKVLKGCKNVIAMTQTAQARLDKYGYDYLGSFDNIIIDEAHVDYFKKVYTSLNFNLLIGLTATPIIYKQEKKKVNGEELTRKITLADDYDILIQGIGVDDLINLGYLTGDRYVVLQPPDLSRLKKSSSNPDGFTSQSLTDVFGSHASIKAVMKAYKLCEDTKTIIFNPTTKVNLRLYEAFKKAELGHKVKMFDSVNKDKNESREDVVNWFKNTPNAILLNVGVFTTGFDVKDIETVIYNKSTMSLSLWLQSCGRGARISDGKDVFTIMDLGLNIERHGYWSDDRDWNEHFVVNEWKTKKPSDLLQVWECYSCGAFNLKGTFFNTELNRFECNECGEPREKSKTSPKLIKGELVEVEKPRYPTSKSIIDYCRINGNNGNLAFGLLEKQIIKLFIHHTTKEHYLLNRDKYIKRIGALYRPVYFAIIRSDLIGANKKLSTQIDKLIKKLDKYYG